MGFRPRLLELPYSCRNIHSLIGKDETFFWPRWIFLRILGIGFLASFLSLSTQINGLIGPRGILPAEDYLNALAGQMPSWKAFLSAPTLLWLDPGAVGLNLICYGGMIAGLLLLLNAWPRAALVFCWFFYLSFVSAARNFSGFQSDGLMLETALLAVFLAPRGLRPGLGVRTPASVVVRLLFWWLCFRLIFESGIAKSTGGDEA